MNIDTYPFDGYCIIDVRSEAEFQRGHVPGAVNIPLMRNDERVIIGTIYKQEGRDPAVAKGYELLGPRFAELYDTFKTITNGKAPLFYCWRGGLRSQISSTIMEWGGFQVFLLKGGYKAYRNMVQKKLAVPRKYILLGGMTGVGKTEILELLRAEGFPVLNLEALANHKGSALGSLGMPEQPSVEMFENLLWHDISRLADSSIVITENESRKIGFCILPDPLWNQMLEADLIEIEVPHEIRVKRLIEEYAHFDPEILAEKTEKLRKRMGGLLCQQAQTAILEGRKEEWVSLLMNYYDKSYRYFMSENAFKGNAFFWDWNQTSESIKLLKQELEKYGIKK
jgi:tRNA 2-selenouridine synthase